MEAARYFHNLWLIVLVAAQLPIAAIGATYVEIAPGDVGELLGAIEDANETDELTVIRLASGSVYEMNLTQASPEPITGKITLIGSGSSLVGVGPNSYGSLFNVLETGELDVSDLLLRGFESAGSDPYESLMTNYGQLSLRDVQFEDIKSTATGTFYETGAILRNFHELSVERTRISNVTVQMLGEEAVIGLDNFGFAHLENVLMVDGAIDPALPGKNVSYIRHAGLGMDISFSSLIRYSTPVQSATEIEAISRYLYRPGTYPKLTMRGSMVLDLGCPFAFSIKVTSEGFNLISDDDCQRDAPTDIVGVLHNPVHFDQGKDGGIEISLPPQSRALDAITDLEFACPATDAIGVRRPQDGDRDGVALCDIGAFEMPRGNSLFSGGENGLFYTAGADGHYVTIQKVRPNDYVVTWNTFDLDGNQAWVLAVGSRDGEVITAPAWIQPEGRLVPGGGAEVDTDQLQDWGMITIRLLNCFEGEFSYESNWERFGSGAFPLDRLAYIDSIGCQD